MADKIRLLIETMMPDLLALKRKKIFSKRQIREILQNREEMEYALVKKGVTLKDYYKALEYEYSLVNDLPTLFIRFFFLSLLLFSNFAGESQEKIFP